MGLFGGIKDTFKKSEAAVVVQNLLEHQAKVGWFDLDPARFANLLVQSAWDEKPDIFSGKFGQRPHKISTAAVALARGVMRMDENESNRAPVIIALGNLLSEVERNGNLYPFNSMDAHLIEAAVKVYMEAANAMGVEAGD